MIWFKIIGIRNNSNPQKLVSILNVVIFMKLPHLLNIFGNKHKYLKIKGTERIKSEESKIK